ncbi:MAG: DNA double-strand break repair nuclease NurA [Acidobacteriota bacterium]|nr:MAG: DNA double-strand break repair nuclease NurA [Acidobacteriota bacterium]
MLHKNLLLFELAGKRDSFRDYSRTQARDAEIYAEELRRTASLTAEEVMGKLGSDEETGALPSGELNGIGSVARAFGPVWRNHEDAREWASKVLSSRTTFAADGSQIYVEKETSLPVGAVQIGWFENPHDPDVPFVKDARLELLTPVDLISGDETGADPESRIGERRFHLEVKRIAEFLESRRDWESRGERMPLAFFDGTLLVSFSLPQTRLQKSFIDAMVTLVRLSEDTRVPVVGYIDRSLSRDLVNLLCSLAGIDEAPSITDAALLTSIPDVLPGWGDRTIFFHSNRSGMGAFRDEGTGLSSVGFCYIRTSSSGPPARLDIPRWVSEAELLDELADVVRAECVIGIGYPYPIETADQTALISSRDRHIFLKALQEFAVREELNFTVTRKDASKSRRR